VDSPYYSELELCKGVVMVFFFFFKVPPLATNELLTMLHPLLKNMLQANHEKGAPFSWLEKPRNHMGQRYELNSVFSL
jgi:hypothetical protein